MYAVQCTAIFTFHVFSPDGPSLPLSTKILFIFWDTFNVLHVFESPYVEQDLMTWLKSLKQVSIQLEDYFHILLFLYVS